MITSQSISPPGIIEDWHRRLARSMTTDMENTRSNGTALFDVYLRLRPQSSNPTEKFIELEPTSDGSHEYITIKPPASDYRKRAVERFGFTKVFEEQASQQDIFKSTTLLPLIEGVLAPKGKNGRDGLLATLGVTGSGKSHTILGTRSQRGLTQMTLDVLFRSIGTSLCHPDFILHDLASVDVSEAHMVAASTFLDSVYGDGDARGASRAQTPMLVSRQSSTLPKTPSSWRLRNPFTHMYPMLSSAPSVSSRAPSVLDENTIRPVNGFARITRSVAKFKHSPQKEVNANSIYTPKPTAKRYIARPSALPKLPSVDDVHVAADKSAEYAIVLSMYEVYNDRIFDLLSATPIASKVPSKDSKRRPLLFKPTEYSPERKVVAGLKKVVCGGLDEALLVLETGLTERRVAGTGSNASSSRSHGFFCIEVKKRSNGGTWTGNGLTIVDLAGSERARNARTAGATLAEAGKINESLMYLGQCCQLLSDASSNSGNAGLVPYRSCKLTELLFTNSFQNSRHPGHHQTAHQGQKAMMIVTADPTGDFNATSQILRYSALAREVTVPRIPSVTSTILYPLIPSQQQQQHATQSHPNGRTSPTNSTTSTTHRPQPTRSDSSQHAHDQNHLIALESECTLLRHRLTTETARRRAAEDSWALATSNIDSAVEDAEAAVREECMDAFETRLQCERERWAAAAEEERVRSESAWDGKVGILGRALGGGGGGGELNVGGGKVGSGEEVKVWEEGMGERLAAVQEENEALRSQVAGLMGELRRVRNEGAGAGRGLVAAAAAAAARTPSRKVKVLKSRPWVAAEENDSEGGENVAVRDGGL